MMNESRKIMIASNSKGKLREYKKMFADDPDTEFVTINDVFGDNPPEEPEETGNTFAENALIKAKYYSELSGLPCLADDSGLCIEALDGFPGVVSKRFCVSEKNPNPTDEDRNHILLQMMHKEGFTESMAYYKCALCLYNSKLDYYYASTGKCKGKFKDEFSGTNGFAFDNHFWAEEYNYSRTLADLVTEEKNKISHRGVALKNLRNNMCNQNRIYIATEE